jgi:hypothetical protein
MMLKLEDAAQKAQPRLDFVVTQALRAIAKSQS